MKDVLGKAVSDYFHQRQPQKLWINNDYGPKEEMPVDIYFRNETKMSTIELAALKYCKGKILDIGACVGSHALTLQSYHEDVTALEISPLACSIMQLRGVEKVVEADFFTYEENGYDTLLLLMNGIGLVSNIQGFIAFLAKAKKMLQPKGQLIFDSSDVSYLYDGSVPLAGDYFGEIRFQYEYKKEQSDWFTWLFLDQGTLYHV
ncbi:MAG: class I SAM-dependent methyltransferase, partial [Chitinophagaceae bacterium]